MKNDQIIIPNAEISFDKRIRMLVIHILLPDGSERFMSPSYFENIEQLKASLVDTPKKAYHWNSVLNAKNCAKSISEMAPWVVSLRIYQPITKNYVTRLF